MKLWIVSANKEEITDSYSFPITGVITNPTVIANEHSNEPNLGGRIG